MIFTLDTIEVSGSPSELGEGQGEQLRERIRTFLEVRQRALRVYAAERGHDATDGLMEIGRQSQAIFAEWDPEGYAEHLGIARGAGVDPALLYTFTNMTDMRDALLLSGRPDVGSLVESLPADAEGCTSALIPGPLTRSGRALVGQTWDLNPTDVEFVVTVLRRPSHGPATFSLTCAGCLTLVGMNEHGLAVGTTNIKVWGSKPGVGYLDILHRAIRCRSAEEASSWVEAAPRAGAHTYWLADANNLVEWECAPFISVRRDATQSPVVRSNHCLAPAIAKWQGEPTPESSVHRLARMNALASAGDIDFGALKAAFADRSQGVLSINRYPEDDQATATNGVFVAEPASRTLWACRGPADRGIWITHQFN